AGHLATHAQDRRLRDAQPARGARALHARGGDDGAAGAHQERARAAAAVSAADGVAGAGRAAREAVGRHPRRIAARDGGGTGVTIFAIRAAILVALLGAWEIVARTANP